MIFNQDLKDYRAPMQPNALTSVGYILRVVVISTLAIMVLGIDLEPLFRGMGL